MKKVVIRNVQVVGMHHYGRRELALGATYTVAAEPSNPYDTNAVAVFDGPRKVGNLKRDCAKAVYRIIQENKAKSKYYIKPLDVAEVKNRRTGPQQTCVMAFKCLEEDTNELISISQSFPCICSKIMTL